MSVFSQSNSAQLAVDNVPVMLCISWKPGKIKNLTPKCATLLAIAIDPQNVDLDFIQWLGENGIPFSLVFTKNDKPKKTFKNIENFKETYERLFSGDKKGKLVLKVIED